MRGPRIEPHPHRNSFARGLAPNISAVRLAPLSISPFTLLPADSCHVAATATEARIVYIRTRMHARTQHTSKERERVRHPKQ